MTTLPSDDGRPSSEGPPESPSEAPTVPPTQTEGPTEEQTSDELSPDEQRRGRRLAVISHPFSMTFRMAYMGDLATQALITLGATAGPVGVFTSLISFAALAQLPGLRLVDRIGKRGLILATQGIALVFSLPLLWFGWLQGLGGGLSWGAALACLTAVMLAVVCGSTAWWPLLHGYVPASRTGRFFSVLRSLWHLGLIVFFLGCTGWLARSPGDFGPLFAVAWFCGLARILLLWRAPERPERKPHPILAVFKTIYRTPPLRRYVAGVTFDQAAFRCVPPFTILLLRSEAGLGEDEVMIATVANFVGGMAALLPAGWLVDRLGPRPVLIWTCLLRGLIVLSIGLSGVYLTGRELILAVGVLIMLWSFLVSAFGVAEVKVLFGLAGEGNPTQLIVGSVVTRAVFAGVIALVLGVTLEWLLGSEAAPPLILYLGLFAVLAAFQVAAAFPFRKLT
ncbi:MAG: MFS transporter [Planctomycetes bacterium]|nr:MFS transporter [Planctomycetota bacterium]